VSSGSRDRIASDVCVSEARRSSCPGEARTDAAARNRYRRIGDRQPREARRDNTNAPTSTVSTARCGPACRVVWEGSGHHDRPLSRLSGSCPQKTHLNDNTYICTVLGLSSELKITD
jgi:hypothetical protein